MAVRTTIGVPPGDTEHLSFRICHRTLHAYAASLGLGAQDRNRPPCGGDSGSDAVDLDLMLRLYSGGLATCSEKFMEKELRVPSLRRRGFF